MHVLCPLGLFVPYRAGGEVCYLRLPCFTWCCVQVSRASTVVRPWELSPVVSSHRHQPPSTLSSCDFGPTANVSVHPGLPADHTDSGYCSPDPVGQHRSRVCSRNVFRARCNVYICHDASPSVRLSVTEVHWCIIANLGFKFRSHFTAHCDRRAAGGRRAARRAACGWIISRHASQC